MLFGHEVNPELHVYVGAMHVQVVRSGESPNEEQIMAKLSGLQVGGFEQGTGPLIEPLKSLQQAPI